MINKYLKFLESRINEDLDHQYVESIKSDIMDCLIELQDDGLDVDIICKFDKVWKLVDKSDRIEVFISLGECEDEEEEEDE